jgi:hypothetical protein
VIDFSGLNYWAILVAWLINVAVGSVWYSPLGFQKLWSKLSGVDMMKIPKNEANRAIGFVAVSALIQSVVLAVVLNSMHAATAVEGLEAGVLLWLGLTAVTTIGNTLYSRLSLRLWWLNASFFLVVMAVNSVILAVWR